MYIIKRGSQYFGGSGIGFTDAQSDAQRFSDVDKSLVSPAGLVTLFGPDTRFVKLVRKQDRLGGLSPDDRYSDNW